MTAVQRPPQFQQYRQAKTFEPISAGAGPARLKLYISDIRLHHLLLWIKLKS